jgi:hypothetical protein
MSIPDHLVKIKNRNSCPARKTPVFFAKIRAIPPPERSLQTLHNVTDGLSPLIAVKNFTIGLKRTPHVTPCSIDMAGDHRDSYARQGKYAILIGTGSRL